MSKVVKVKFRNSGRVYFFDALDFEINKGDGLVVDTARGNMLGEAIASPEEIEEDKLVAPLKPVIRTATEEDFELQEYYRGKESEASAICQKKIAEHGLGMKLVDTEYAFNGTKLTFYFTADQRVDFRELLKDLTSIFKTRIDLRQIGDRDEAKKCGGLGFCGRPVCCNTFLNDFTPVSIKMAKTQNLSLNPVKISGICGKLMCCLRYEQDAYEAMQKIMPRAGKEFNTPDGVGIVLENNVITETTKLKVTIADGTFDVRSYPFRELEPVTAQSAAKSDEPTAENEAQPAPESTAAPDNDAEAPKAEEAEKPAEGEETETDGAKEAEAEQSARSRERRSYPPRQRAARAPQADSLNGENSKPARENLDLAEQKANAQQRTKRPYYKNGRPVHQRRNRHNTQQAQGRRDGGNGAQD